MAKTREQYIQEHMEDGSENISFSLIDEHTVDRLRRDGDIQLPYKKVDIPKDERWNTKLMSSRLLQGILNGDDIKTISRSMMDVIGNNATSAIRNARTMTTGAECRGRQDSYNNLANQGVIQKKVWIATADDRTRESHLDIDGEEVDIDQPFSNGLMYPADPDGDPSEVWNCRCSIRDHIIGFRRADGSISRVEYRRDTTLHDEQIAEERGRRGVEEKPAEEKERIESAKIMASMSGENYTAYMDMISDADNSNLYRLYADDINSVRNVGDGRGCYRRATNTIDYKYCVAEGRDKYSTISHEYNHFFDTKFDKSDGLSYNEVGLINERCSFISSRPPIQECASTSDEFLSALRKDMETLKDKGLAECYTEFRSDTLIFNGSCGIQDALDGFYSASRAYGGWGHGDRYYNRMYNDFIKGFGYDKELKSVYQELGFNVRNQTQVKELARQYEAANEAWANVGAAVTCGGKELEAMERYMPNTLQAYKDIIGAKK